MTIMNDEENGDKKRNGNERGNENETGIYFIIVIRRRALS